MPASRGAPVGAVVGITYVTGSVVAVGDALVTSTGRAYRVLEVVRARPHKDAPSMLRYTLSCIVVGGIDALDGSDAFPSWAQIHTLLWWKRDRKYPSRQ